MQNIKLIIIKTVDKFNKHLKIFIILSAALHFVFIFICNYDCFINLQSINDIDKNAIMKTTAFDFNSLISADNQNNNIYKPITAETKIPNTIKNSSDIKSKNIKKKIDNANHTKKVVTSNTKTKTNLSKQSTEVNDLLGNLMNIKNIKKSNDILQKNNYVNKISKNKFNDIQHDEVSKYKYEITQSISDKFYDSSRYIGQTCDLHIKISPDGKLISVISTKGDQALCQAAISATKLAIIPKPPNYQIYTLFQDTILKFAPQ